MPPETKRKRGRPSNASKSTSIAPQNPPEEYEADVEEDTRPRKRGRPKKSTEDAPEVINEEKKGRGRGRRPDPEETEPDKFQAEEQPPTKRKRGRPSLDKSKPPILQDVEVNVGRPSRQTKAKGTRASQPEEVETQPSEAERRKRGRKPTRHVETEAPEEPQPDTEPQPQTKRKRGRPSLNQEPQDEPVEQERPKRRGRRSLQEPPPDDAQNQSRKESKQKRGRRGSAIQEATPKAQDDGPKKRKRVSAGRPSLSSKDKSDQINKDGEQDTSKTSRRRSTNNDEPPPSPEKPYLHLVSKTRRVRPSTIAAKWSPLTGPSLHAVSSILEMAHVPIIQRTSHTQNRHTHATTALRLITHRINKKLSKGLPFPAASAAVTSSRTAKDGDGGRETELDFEAVLDARALLERQLVPGLQAVELLRTERNKMESDLERDYERLRDLEARARGQVREKRELLKKAHVLAPTSRVTPADDGDSRPQLDDSLGNIFKNSDETLNPLSLQLADHMDSIRTNLSQANGIVPQIAHTRAALQDVLFRYLEKGAYESAVLGPSEGA